MSYEVTATRRRPHNFTTMLGQDFVSSALSHSIAQGRIAHAYLFCGPRGVGKTSAARILARSLNCEKGPTIHPCDQCANCQEIVHGRSLDVIEIDGASNTGVGDIREIKDEVLFQPSHSRYKIYIIDEVHMLSMSAFNALLKTIEEPPEYVIFIFATTEIHKVPATIKSRCQQYSFRLIGLDTVKDALAQTAAEMQIEAEADALFWLAKESGGSMRDAYTLFDQAVALADGHLTLAKIKEKMGLLGLEELNQLLSFCAQGQVAEALSLVDDYISKGISIEQFLIDFAEYLRNLLLIKSGIERESVLGYPKALFASHLLDVYQINQLEAGLAWVFQLYRDNRYSINPRFELELFIARLCQLHLWIDPQHLVQQIKKIRQDMLALNQESVLPLDTQPPQPIVPLETPAPPAWDGQISSLQSALLQACKTSKMSLYTILSQTDMQLQGQVLTLTLTSAYAKQSLQHEQDEIEKLIKKITQTDIHLRLEMMAALPEERKTEKTTVEKICEVFKGEVYYP